MSEPSAARPRKRTVEDGKVITNVPECFGRYIADEAEDAGIAPATFARMLLIEALKGRGLSLDILRERYKEREETPAPVAV